MDQCELFFKVVDETPNSFAQDPLSSSSSIPFDRVTGVTSRWRKRLYQLEKKFGFFIEPVEATTEKEWESVVRKRVREQEIVQWLEAARTKSTLTMYAELKQQITAETRLYDNSLGSRLLFEARAGALRTLVYKQRFDNNVQSTVCRVCEETDHRELGLYSGHLEKKSARNPGAGIGQRSVSLRRRPIKAVEFLDDFFSKCPD
ncbi:hypothetical protein HPB47_014946 [Ixodes persulcatus]|uniref:Uncharacterized protein n=1 Tax=Ixodes persulcatus TaxID=34615 RepID=A0AC60QUU9_IXOPE|nr:hypothetical protein HPB47_014946 [Ixodes persulcatus]